MKNRCVLLIAIQPMSLNHNTTFPYGSKYVFIRIGLSELNAIEKAKRKYEKTKFYSMFFNGYYIQPATISLYCEPNMNKNLA